MNSTLFTVDYLSENTAGLPEARGLDALKESCLALQAEFRQAARQSSNQMLAGMLNDFAREHKIFSEAIDRLLAVRTDLALSETLTLPVLPKTKDFVETILPGNDAQIVSACLDRASSLMSLYHKYLTHGNPSGSVRLILERQLARVRRFHRRLSALKSVYG